MRRGNDRYVTSDKGPLLRIAKSLGDISVIYDVGSRDALDGIELAKAFGARELHIFECNPPSFRKCVDNVRKLVDPSEMRVYLNECAVSDFDGEANFFPINVQKTTTPHADGNPGASSLLRANTAYSRESYVQDEMKVRSTTLRTYCANHRPPDLLWIDVQGAELSALRGLGDALDVVRLIHVEVGFRAMYEKQPLFWNVHELLHKNFKLIAIDLGRWPAWPRLYSLLRFGPWVGNAIYVRREN